MGNTSLTLSTKVFFGSFLKSPTQMGSLSINNSVTNISRLGTFKDVTSKAVNREDILSRRYRDRDLAKFESSRRYRER